MITCPHCGTVFAQDDEQFFFHKMRCEAHLQMDNTLHATQSEIAMQKARYDAQLATYQSNLQNAIAAGTRTQISGASSVLGGMGDMIVNGIWDPEIGKKEKAKKKLADWAKGYFNGSQE